MKKFFALSLFLLVSTVIQTALAQTVPAQDKTGQVATQSSVKKLSVDQVDKLLDDSRNVIVIDVRRPDEIEQYGSLIGYVNIPLDQLEQRLNEISKDKQILTLSNRAGRAGRAAELLEKKGYKTAGVTGIQDYTEAGGKKYLVHPKVTKKE